MYDWPERRDEVDAEWAAIRDCLRAHGIDAPDRLTRDFSDLHGLWRSPTLLFAQACWGPLQQGLLQHVQVIGQPDYSAFEGGQGALYSSAIVMRPRMDGHARPSSSLDGKMPGRTEGGVRAPTDGRPLLPLELLRNQRLAYNSLDSMSGILAITRDLEAIGEGLDIFSRRSESGGHRQSIVAVAEGKADVAAIDCRSWDLARRFEQCAAAVEVVGWTGQRKGLPYITATTTPPDTMTAMRKALASIGALASA